MPKCNACGIIMGTGFMCTHPKMSNKFVCLKCCSGIRKGRKCRNFDPVKKLCKLRGVENEAFGTGV